MKRLHIITCLCILSVFVVACGNEKLNTPSPAPSETFTPLPTKTLTPTPTYTPTLTPTETITPIPTSTPTPEPGTTQISPVDGMVLSYIPAGTFLMGEDADRALEECQLLSGSPEGGSCSRDWFTNAEPIHSVTLDAFWMDTHEVTNAQYAQCVTFGACSPPSETGSDTRSSYYDDAAYEDYPVISVDWHQATEYCNWAGRGLPTEAQWEYAARGGLAGQLYPWGDSFDSSLVNFCDVNCLADHLNPDYNDGYEDTAPVGNYPANGYGLFDMAGNVWEWVADWYGSYSSEAITNPTGVEYGGYRSLRGGSWVNNVVTTLVSYRDWYYPDVGFNDTGFRCALSLTPIQVDTPMPTPALTPLPTPVPGPTQISTIDGMVLRYIPGGSFQMGGDADQALKQCRLLWEPFTTVTCSRDWFSDIEPVHNVTLDAFWMDEHEVTNAQYERCVNAGACSLPYFPVSLSRDSYYGDPLYADYPVIYMNWNQAVAYCTWAGRQLPTEAQWEYAALGGFDGLLYPWGDIFNGELANFCDANCTFEHANHNYNDGYADTSPVGYYPANGYGLFDMAGNVREWVADWYGLYSNDVVSNPTGPISGEFRVQRGGSWLDSGVTLLLSSRYSDIPTMGRSHAAGFRCSLTP